MSNVSKQPSTPATFFCNAVVTPKKSTQLGEDIAYGSIRLNGEWHEAFCPRSVVRRTAPKKGEVYVAEVVKNPMGGKSKTPYMVVRIDREKTTPLSEEACEALVEIVYEAGLFTAEGITEGLNATYDPATKAVFCATEEDVWVTLHELWRAGRISRLTLTHDAASEPAGTLWAANDFEIEELLDDD